MSHAIFHAQSSVRRFGGRIEDYQPIHDWLVLIWTVRQAKSGKNCPAVAGPNLIHLAGGSEFLQFEKECRKHSCAL
jgi:hypothetical protein